MYAGLFWYKERKLRTELFFVLSCLPGSDRLRFYLLPPAMAQLTPAAAIIVIISHIKNHQE